MSIYSTIYKATCITTGKSYIGFTSRLLEERIQEHKRNSKSIQYRFYDAIREYGWNNFTWETVYQSWDTKHCHKVMESYFIEQFDSYYNGYNSTPGGEGIDPETMKQLWNDPNSKMNSIESRQKRSKSQKKQWDDPNSVFNSSEMRQKRIEEQKKQWDNPNSVFNSQEYKQKLRDKSCKFTYEITTPNGEIVIVKNLHQYCKENNLNSGHMSKVANGRLFQHKGYKVRKI